MKTIWKYTLKITEVQKVMIPKGADILCVQTQFDLPAIWAIVDSSETLFDSRIFLIVGTGNPMPANPCEYIGTFQAHRGNFVGHLFEITTS